MSNITIYQDANYGGASQTLAPGKYDMRSLSFGNDQLSSLRVPDGMVVSLFADAGFRGTRKVFSADTPYVGDDFNDMTSSLVVANIGVKVLTGPIVFPDGIPITASYKIYLFKSGKAVFSIHAHDSTKLETYDYGVIIVLTTPDKTAYTFEHQGHVANVFLGDVHDDNSITTTTNPAITTNWQQILHAGVAKVSTTTDSHFLGEGWEAEALQIAETVGQIVIKVIGSAGNGNTGGSSGSTSSN